MTTPKRESELLLDELLPFARKMLAEHGEFYPYGGFTRADGSVVHVGASDPSTDRPQAFEVLQILREDLRRRVEVEPIKVTATFHDVRVAGTDGRRTSAIQATLEHADSYCAEVFFPYEIDPHGGVSYGEPFAQEGERLIFSPR